MSSSSNSQRSNNHLLLITTASTVLSLGISVLLWRSVSKLHQKIDELETTNNKHTGMGGSSHRRHTSGRRRSLSERQQDNEDHTVSRSLPHLPAGEYPQPELVLTADAEELPIRFQKAGKDDPAEGRQRFVATLEWRERHDMNTALYRAWPNFELIKDNYPHYFHGKGQNGEPVFYEQPPKTDLKALRAGGVQLKELLQHYAMICEFQWQYVTRDDEQKSIYIVDLEGMGMYDFVGECKDFVREASQFASAHYPERAGVVLVVNVPYWFKMVWNVVKNWIDEVTLQKIFILRGKDEIFQTLSDKIPIENIPKQYGGESPYELGNSLEEQLLRNLMEHNNDKEDNGGICPNAGGSEPCQFCTFRYARNY
ncbi:SEC14 cytosolic factor [Seminavis robusta]|uniref:SEC14 cytosolic factor n=1 Tax=Seminavis robusta TaxID=568900 RepID=A0A9N8EPN9_9STRA|nr:SEC14 cytosolic factor [Seminavis robusta]|eukprot:Sro1504_g278070.1 SEC14 cytosolic factor (368) ;mRNA; r:3902-5164